MPTTFRPSTTGSPEILCNAVSASTSRTDIVGGIVIGSLTTPLSKRLTFATSAACVLGDMFLCTIPRPPSCAIAIASRPSVTVSIAAESRGIFSVMRRGRRGRRAEPRGGGGEGGGGGGGARGRRGRRATRTRGVFPPDNSVIYTARPGGGHHPPD